MTLDLPPTTAARRLASELKLPSWKGSVMVAHRSEGEVLIVAAERSWLAKHSVPRTYCGYRVEADGPLVAHAQIR